DYYCLSYDTSLTAHALF
nr:immunoglobulin light chain junction region [Macaca mulatta]MOX11205.1 immunoglobulin light chain junction region [Macaca mulatta]MOX11210.1 immunoglobulin light chain junction region [Macaca mulatta]MOX11215.1 immunoglobulin light chain junction region [Macaca mulatta]MOX11362.1 immunoglobulin light chain junction region [Macaca mulatta]